MTEDGRQAKANGAYTGGAFASLTSGRTVARGDAGGMERCLANGRAQPRLRPTAKDNGIETVAVRQRQAYAVVVVVGIPHAIAGGLEALTNRPPIIPAVYRALDR